MSYKNLDQEKWCRLCSNPTFDDRYFCNECKKYLCDWCTRQYSTKCSYCKEVIYCCNSCKNKSVYKLQSSRCWSELIDGCKNKLCVKCNNSAQPCLTSACKDHPRNMCVICKKAECCSDKLYFKTCVEMRCDNKLCYQCFVEKNNKCFSEHIYDEYNDNPEGWKFE